MSDLALGMGWSIYLMLGAVAFMILSIVVLIIRSEKKRAQRIPQGGKQPVPLK